MKKTLLLSALAITGLLFNACKKDKTGYSSQSELNYEIQGSNTTNGVTLKTSATSTVQWNAGYINPRQIKFEAKKAGTEIEYKTTNTAQIDLMAPVAVNFGGFTIPSGTYDEIELKILLDKNGAGPAMQLSGNFNNGSISLPIVLEIDESLEIKTEQADVVITDNSIFTAVTVIGLSIFTEDITETMLLNAQLSNGVILISRHDNVLMYNKIVNNFRNKHHHCLFKHHKK